MKLLEKFVLILYSLFMLAVSVIVCLVIFKVISIDQIKYCIDCVVDDWALAVSVIAVAIVCMLLSVRCLFFRKKKQIKKSTATDILLENDSGRLLISKSAIENAVNSIVKDSLRLNTDTKVTVDIDPADNVSIYIFIMLDRALRVRELTLDLQVKIKEQIKDDFGVEVKQVNIKVDSDEKKIEKLEKENEKQAEKIEKVAEKQAEKLEKTSEKQAEEENEKQIKKSEIASKKQLENERQVKEFDVASEKQAENIEKSTEKQIEELEKISEEQLKGAEKTDEKKEEEIENIDETMNGQIEIAYTTGDTFVSDNKIEN